MIFLISSSLSFTRLRKTTKRLDQTTINRRVDNTGILLQTTPNCHQINGWWLFVSNRQQKRTFVQLSKLLNPKKMLPFLFVIGLYRMATRRKHTGFNRWSDLVSSRHLESKFWTIRRNWVSERFEKIQNNQFFSLKNGLK